MKVLIVVPNLAMEPMGLAYISAVLKKAGHEVDCLKKHETYKLSSILSNKKYDFVATGAMSVDYKLVKEIVKVAKKNKTRVIIGGGVVTSEPELISCALDVDYSVIGEGEETIVELLSCLENNGELESIAGIGFFKKGKFVVTNPRKSILNLDSLPFPDWESIMDFEIEFNKVKSSDGYLGDVFDYTRLYPIICSRSCPYQCTFCYHPLGNKYRQRSIDSVMNELMIMISKYRINIVSIYDELFSYDEQRVIEFCKKIKEFTSTLPWDVRWNCQMRVDNVNGEILDIMKDAGCHLVSYGFESYSAKVLKSMKKHIKPEDIHKAVHVTLDKQISIQANFIFGDIAETKETANETLEFWKEHVFAGINLGFIIPCPDSYLYRYCIERGIIKDKLDFIENHIYDIYNMTQMSSKEFYELRYNILRATLKYQIKTIPLNVSDNFIKVRCPHCNSIIEYKNFDVAGVVINKSPIIPPSRYFFNKNINCRYCHKRFYIVSRLYIIHSKIMFILATPTLYKLYSKTQRLIKQLIIGRLMRLNLKLQ